MKSLIQKWNNISLVKRIIVGLIVGIILGLTVPQATVISLLGDLFVGALKAIAPLLVLFLVMEALSKQEQGQKTNMTRVIVLYLLGTFLAGCIAVVASFSDPGRECNRYRSAGRSRRGSSESADESGFQPDRIHLHS